MSDTTLELPGDLRERPNGGSTAQTSRRKPMHDRTIRAGDHVEHGPTGETWVVGRTTAEHVEPFGWPRSRALLADCRRVRVASDAEHAEALADAVMVFG